MWSTTQLWLLLEVGCEFGWTYQTEFEIVWDTEHKSPCTNRKKVTKSSYFVCANRVKFGSIFEKTEIQAAIELATATVVKC